MRATNSLGGQRQGARGLPRGAGAARGPRPDQCRPARRGRDTRCDLRARGSRRRVRRRPPDHAHSETLEAIWWLAGFGLVAPLAALGSGAPAARRGPDAGRRPCHSPPPLLRAARPVAARSRSRRARRRRRFRTACCWAALPRALLAPPRRPRSHSPSAPKRAAGGGRRRRGRGPRRRRIPAGRAGFARRGAPLALLVACIAVVGPWGRLSGARSSAHRAALGVLIPLSSRCWPGTSRPA